MKKERDDAFWREIIYKNGKLDEEAILNELADFSFLIESISHVYYEITGGMVSKPLTLPKEVLSIFHELHLDLGITQSDVQDMIAENPTREDLVEALEDYFQLDHPE